MYCPSCGTQNPETGKFCRSCGTYLGSVGEALSGKLRQEPNLIDRKGKPICRDGAIRKLFAGFAFLVVTIALAFSVDGREWWFWMLIPAFTSLGAGISQYVQIKRAERGERRFAAVAESQIGASCPPASLQQPAAEYTTPAESSYKTGDLVPPSVIDATTRHLEMNSEGKTMTLPKK